MKIETKIQLEHRLHNKVKERIKDPINERMQERLKHHQHNTKIKKKTKHFRTNKPNNTNYREHFATNTNYTTFKFYPEYIHHETKLKELEDFKNSTDYEEMWNIAIDKWTRNWNFYKTN